MSDRPYGGGPLDRASWPELAGLGWALGTALFSSITFALYLAAVSPAVALPPALVFATAGCVAGGRVLRRARRERVAARASTMPLIVAGGLCAAVGQVGLTAWLAARAPFTATDAWSFWALKARMFDLGGPRPGYFHDPLTLYTHPDYPLNYPLVESALFRLPGALGLRLAALIAPACLAALLLLLYAGLTRLYGRATAALATGALALVPAVVVQGSGGDADVPLTMYLGGAALYYVLWRRIRNPLDSVVMGLLAGGAIWTKKEGLPLAALLLLVFVAGEALRRHGGSATVADRLRRVATVVAAALALPLPWLLFSRLIHPIGRDFLPYTPGVFLAHADRLPHVVAFCLLQLLYFTRWSILWVALAATLLLAGRRLSSTGRLLLALLLGQFIVYVLAFVFSDWQPYVGHLKTSLDRLLLQAVPLALLLLLEAVHSISRDRRAVVERVSAPARGVAAR